MTTTLGILLFGGAGLILFWAFSGSRQVSLEDPTTTVRDIQMAPNGIERVLYPAMVSVGRLLMRLPFMPGRLPRLRKRIILAGKQLTWSTEKAMAYKALGLIAGCTMAMLLLWTEQSMKGFFGAAMFVVVGWFSVDYHLDKVAAKRQLEIQQALPDVLDQISVCVEAGLGFDAALARVTETNHNILADELRRTMQDIRLGVPRNQAMRSLLDRTDVQELRLFVRALIQAERSGIPLARVLLIQSEEVREKRRQAAEERAMKLPVKLVLPLVLCILPSLFTVIMGPAAIRMVRDGLV